MNIVEQNISSVSELCKLHNVKNLYLFGSILSENFSPDSDIDFLVNFKNIDLFQYFDNYMELKEKLEKLLNRQIDLLEEQTVRNPVLRRSIDRSKKLVYG